MRRTTFLGWMFGLILCPAPLFGAQPIQAILGTRPGIATPDETHKPMRLGLLGGMGVSYVNAQDIVDRVNGAMHGFGVLARAQDFKASVEFFAGVTIPVSVDWVLKVDYAYILGSYNVENQFGRAEFIFSAHLPTVIWQYVLVDAGVYNVKAGVGGGYHFGEYSERLLNRDDQFTGRGPGATIDLEANTAFGDDFFGYLGAHLRWEFIGDLTNSRGRSPGATGGTTSLQFFSVGARLGFTFYF